MLNSDAGFSEKPGVPPNGPGEMPIIPGLSPEKGEPWDLENESFSRCSEGLPASRKKAPPAARRPAVSVSGPISNEESRSSWIEAELDAADRERLARGLHLEVPSHFEVHPYHRSQALACSNGCAHCTKGDDKRDLRALGIEGIKPAPLLRLIDELGAAGVRETVISGNSTEPLLYPWIDDVILGVKRAGMRVRLYSNFHYGAKLLPLVSAIGDGDVIRISLDAGSGEAYSRVHRPSIPAAFERVMLNIADLSRKRDELGRQFSISIAFLMTRQNSAQQDIERLVDWSLQNRLDMIRFTVPLQPQIGNTSFSSEQQLNAVETAAALAFLRDLQRKDKRAADLIRIMDDAPELPSKTFRNCHHWKVVPVLGATGRFFPCTSVSLAALRDKLGAADINDPGFDFWEFWENTSRHWGNIDAAVCADGEAADCTRYEFVMNEQIERLMQSSASCTNPNF